MTVWWKEVGRKPYLNYCIDGTNNTEQDFTNLTHLFSPVVFNFTFSVVCSKDENMKDLAFRNLDIIKNFQSKFYQKGYNVRTLTQQAKMISAVAVGNFGMFRIG